MQMHTKAIGKCPESQNTLDNINFGWTVHSIQVNYPSKINESLVSGLKKRRFLVLRWFTSVKYQSSDLFKAVETIPIHQFADV